MYYHHHPHVILIGSNDTRKKHVEVYSQERTLSPYQGSVSIKEPKVWNNGMVNFEVEFTPSTEGSWWYFSLSPCFAVDGAVKVAVIKFGPTHALNIMKLSSHAQIKKRNSLSKRIELLTFYKGREIENEDIIGQPPATLVQPDPDVSLPVPTPTHALTEVVAKILAMRSL